MSTRSSVFYVEGSTDDSSCHIYWKLAERELESGGMVGAPLCMEIKANDKVGTLRIPISMADAICETLDVKPEWQIL